MENQLNWKLVNPEGIVQSESTAANLHPAKLEGKTILLRWSGKHNGDVFLDRIASLLAGKIDDVKLIKAWEIFPESANISQNSEVSKKIAADLSKLKPDISIAAQGD